MGDHGLIVGGFGLGHRQFRLDPGCPGRFLDPLRALLEELESSTTEEEIAAERAVAKNTNVVAFTRQRPARQPFPEHLRRERVVEPGPTVCLCCGSPRPRKLGEDITETLEVVPRQARAEHLVRFHDWRAARDRKAATRRLWRSRCSGLVTVPLSIGRANPGAGGRHVILLHRATHSGAEV